MHSKLTVVSPLQAETRCHQEFESFISLDLGRLLPGAVAGPGVQWKKGLIGAENKTEDEDFGLK